MSNKRYVIIVVAFLLAIVIDAFLFTGVLQTPYSRVPTSYHIGNIVMLTAAFSIIGDIIFKADVLR